MRPPGSICASALDDSGGVHGDHQFLIGGDVPKRIRWMCLGTLWIKMLGRSEFALRKFSAALRIYGAYRAAPSAMGPQEGDKKDGENRRARPYISICSIRKASITSPAPKQRRTRVVAGQGVNFGGGRIIT